MVVKAPESVRSLAGRRVAACAALTAGAVLLCGEAVHARGTGGVYVSAVRWVAAPALAVVLPGMPAAHDGALSTTLALVPGAAPGVTEVTFRTMRRATRTRRGGRFGP